MAALSLVDTVGLQIWENEADETTGTASTEDGDQLRVEVAQGRWIRSLTRTIGFGATCLLWAAFFAWLAFHHHERGSNGTEYTSVVGTVFLLCIALPGVVLGIREFRAGLWIDADTVIVRGVLRTSRLSPNQIDGFKPEKRLGPTPMLHRKQGAPILVGALARGGFLNSRDVGDLKTLDALCDQLNALLKSVQSEQPSRSTAELGMRPSDRKADYVRLRQILVAITIGVVAACIAAPLLLQTVAAIALASAIALAEIASTYTILRGARTRIEREARDTASV